MFKIERLINAYFLALKMYNAIQKQLSKQAVLYYNDIVLEKYLF